MAAAAADGKAMAFGSAPAASSLRLSAAGNSRCRSLYSTDGWTDGGLLEFVLDILVVFGVATGCLVRVGDGLLLCDDGSILGAEAHAWRRRRDVDGVWQRWAVHRRWQR